MTVIAFDRSHIAWDGLVTLNSEVYATNAKKVKVVDGTIYGFAGDLGIMDVMIGWHRRGAKQAEFDKSSGRLRHYEDASYELLVITRNEVVVYSNDIHFRTALPDIHAIGSGSAYARGALYARASAFRAVRIACQLDVGCGGTITVMPFTDIWPGGRNLHGLERLRRRTPDRKDS